MGFLTGKSTWDGGDVANQNQQKEIDMRNSNLNANRVDQVGPNGSMTWSEKDGKWTQTTTLDPAQQALLNNQNQIGINLGNAGVNLSAAIAPTLSAPVDTSGLNAWQNVIGEGATNLMTHDWLANSANKNGGAVAAAGTQQATQATTNPVGNYSWGGGMGGGGGVSSSGSGSSSSTPAAPAVDPYKVRDTFDTSGVTAKLPDSIDDTSRQRVEEALMSRLNPQLAQDEAALRTRLLNSGIEVGTDAYNREMNLHAQKSNDARMQAILAGGQEEDRQTKLLQGLNDQQFAQALATGKFGQDADIVMANNATSRSNASTAAGAVTGAASINNAGAMERLQAQLGQQSKEFNVNTGFKAAAFNNDLRRSQLEEQLLLRQEPLKELAAINALSKPTMPTFSSYYTDNGEAAKQGPPQVIDSGNGLLDIAGDSGAVFNSWFNTGKK